MNLPPPYGGCSFKPLTHFKKYTRPACLMECLTTYITQICGCRNLFMPNKNSSVCSPIQLETCVKDAERNYIETLPACAKDCPVSCTEVLYSYMTSQASFTKQYKKYIQQNTIPVHDEAYWEDNLVQINVYYTDMLEEIVVHQAAYNVFSLLCDLGGALGLILGASVITLMELIDLAIMATLFKGTPDNRGWRDEEM